MGCDFSFVIGAASTQRLPLQQHIDFFQTCRQNSVLVPPYKVVVGADEEAYSYKMNSVYEGDAMDEAIAHFPEGYGGGSVCLAFDIDLQVLELAHEGHFPQPSAPKSIHVPSLTSFPCGTKLPC